MSVATGNKRAATTTTTATSPAAVAAPDPRRWAALGIIAVAQLMVVLDATIVNIALPQAQVGPGHQPTPTGSGWSPRTR